MRRPLPWRGPLLAAAALASPLLAHDDDPKILDRLPPVLGAGYRAGAGGGTNGPGAMFDSSGVTLLAWLPLDQLDNSQSGNDCWGYVSGSGREYAIIGTYGGTCFVEITDPANPGPVMVIDGPDSLWRDIKIYQDHAYAVSEGGSGIQVISLANIDAGQVSLVKNVTVGGATTATHNVAIDEDSGFLYRTGGGSHGLRIYDLANPADPQYVASWDTRYVHDAQIVTYTSGPLAGRQVAYCCSGFNGGFDQTGLTVLDVTDKGNVQVLDQVFYANPGYSHQGWLSPDRQVFYLGDELDEDGIINSTTHVFDVSDPTNVSYQGVFTNANKAITHNLYTVGDVIFEANYTSGLRVFDASDPMNPVETAWFDTRPEDDAVSFNGLWNVYPYFPSGTVIGSDLERGLFVWHVGEPPIQISLPNGAPETLDPDGDSVAVDISETNPGDLQQGSELLWFDVGAGFTSVPLVSQGGGAYDAVFPATTCGDEVAWYVEAADSGGQTWTHPAGAPGATHVSLSVENLLVSVDDDMETPSGWTGGVAGDTATTGVWVRVDPRGTAAQPEDDHTDPAGTQCWVTGQGPVGGGLGDNDVDGGYTTLLTPVLDLSGLDEPRIGYWRWYSNDQGGSPNADIFRVDISADGGSTWHDVEDVGPAGPETAGGWFRHEFRVADIVTPTSQVRLRFIAEDAGSGSIVEAAIDDFQVLDAQCDLGPGDNYCFANANSTGLPAKISAAGSDVVADDDLTLIASQLPPNQFGYFLTSMTQDLVFNPGGSQGNLCLGGTILRFAKQAQNSGAAGEFSLALDLSAFPPPYAGPVLPGQTWNFQAWYRDVNPTPTSNFTDGRSILFQ